MQAIVEEYKKIKAVAKMGKTFHPDGYRDGRPDITAGTWVPAYIQ